jgi:hypothetical protein
MQTAVDSTSSNVVYLHSKRKGWGLAAVAWERNGKRGYVFVDGEERTFAKEYCNLFEPVRATTPEAQRLLAEVGKPDKASTASKNGRARKASGKTETRTVDEQIAVFGKLFPDGFVGAPWRKKHRGTGKGRRLKRHRDAAVADARAQLSREAIEALTAEGRTDEVLRRAVAVLEATDLVTKSQLEALRVARATTPLVEGLCDYLHEEDPEGKRFGEFARRLGRNTDGRCNWPLFTALRALVQPEAHVCVRTGAIRAQAAILFADVGKDTRITARRYLQYLAIAENLRDRLTAAGMAPTDLIDIYDFMWETTRPAHAELYDEVRAEAAAGEGDSDSEAKVDDSSADASDSQSESDSDSEAA